MKAGFERWRKESQEDENTFSLQGKKKKEREEKPFKEESTQKQEPQAGVCETIFDFLTNLPRSGPSSTQKPGALWQIAKSVP